jgi:hypothetical protein
MRRNTALTAYLIAASLVAMAIPGSTASAVPNEYIESFTTTAYRDNAANLAHWNTVAGRLELPPLATATLSAYITGAARDVVVRGDLAFVADGPQGLRIFNINNAAAPFLVSTYDTPGFARGVAVAGEHAYVADDASGLLVISIANPAAPTLAGSYNTSGGAMGVAVSGNVALVADFVGLQSLNISNPASPTLTSTTYPPSGNVYDVAIAGDQAYVAVGSAGMYVFSLANPATPLYMGLHDTPGLAMRVKVQGDHAFIADGAAGLRIVSVVNPAAPTLVATLDTPTFATGVAVDGEFVYVSDSTSGVQFIDIANPAAPVLLATHDTPGDATNLVVVGDKAYVADLSGGLQIIRIAKPTALPTLAGSLAVTGTVKKCVVSGELAAVITQSPNNLHLVSLADPAAPVIISSTALPAAPQDAAMAGNLAVVSLGFSGLWLLDITNPAAPFQAGMFSIAANLGNLDISGDHVFVVDGSTLRVIDITNPGSPTLVGSVGLSTPADVVVDGDLAYTAGVGTGWLQIVNVANPAAPVALSHVVTGAGGDALAVSGDLVAIATVTSIKLIDVSNPLAGVVVGSYNGGDFRDVALVGNSVYAVRVFVNGMVRVDVQDPANPVLAGSLSLAGTVEALALCGDHAFVAAGSAGVQVAQVYERRFDATFDRGRSLSIDASTDIVRRARLAATQTSGVSWDLSGDGGTTFQTFTPGADWAVLAGPGSDLRWRTTHGWSPAVPNPRVDDVHIEWLYDHPLLDAVTDIGNDQGRQVRVMWTRSAHDFIGDATQAVEYAVYRRIDPVAKAAAAMPDDASPALRANAEAMKAAGWDYVTRVPVLLDDAYSVVVPTLADSTITDGQHWSSFRVIALTATPGVFFASPPDSGYSLDNLAPGVPANLVVQYDAGTGHALTWDESLATDFRHFRVYRGVDPGFVPSAATLVTTTAANGWVDASAPPGPASYKVTALDFAGNESAAAAVSSVSAVDGATLPRHFALAANVPNPFNPSTRVNYEVPVGGGEMTLRIYDLRGQLVRTLVDGAQPAGRHAAIWDGRDEAGRPLPSGVYVGRLQAGAVVETRAMVLAK